MRRCFDLLKSRGQTNLLIPPELQAKSLTIAVMTKFGANLSKEGCFFVLLLCHLKMSQTMAPLVALLVLLESP
jgi:hypothetical protein